MDNGELYLLVPNTELILNQDNDYYIWISGHSLNILIKSISSYIISYL